LTKRTCNFRTNLLPESHPNARVCDLDTTLCPGKLKPWKTAGEILVSSWKSEQQPTVAKTLTILLSQVAPRALKMQTQSSNRKNQKFLFMSGVQADISGGFDGRLTAGGFAAG
jgi:hypothetical protein